jgi:hypothetical protein
MRDTRGIWRAVLIALVGAGALSGCYYDSYTGYWRPYPGYYPNLGYYPFPWQYPPTYSPYFSSPPPQSNPAPGYAPQGYTPGAAPPADAPVERAPLPPPA